LLLVSLKLPDTAFINGACAGGSGRGIHRTWARDTHPFQGIGRKSPPPFA
jgi:hypothetical protein